MTAYEMSSEIARDQEFVETEFAARSAVAGLERIRGNLFCCSRRIQKLSESALANGLEVSASPTPDFNSDFALGPRQPQSEARHHFEEVFSGGRAGICTPSNFTRRLGWRGASRCKKRMARGGSCLNASRGTAFRCTPQRSRSRTIKGQHIRLGKRFEPTRFGGAPQQAGCVNESKLI